MKILLLDNFDSFTYNLVHLIEKVSGFEVEVRRNNEMELAEFEAYDKVVLSPGPGLPEEAGILLPFIRRYYKSKKILGVCLGHQALAVALGGSLVNLSRVFHGVAEPTHIIAPDSMFSGIPATFAGGRYHSWVVDKLTLPEAFKITAEDNDGNIMAMRHTTFNLSGVQFHPESILTEYGEKLLKNWIDS